jgi:hypothetical protein
MTIAAVSFLWYLPLCLLPFIIYYLMRRFPASVNWGASYVLHCAMQRLQRKWIDEHLLLLLIRLCALALVIVAFARLTLHRGGDEQIRGSGVRHVIVFDASYSMLATEGDQSRWNQARQGIDELLSLLGRGETWSFLVLEREPRWLVENAVVGKDAEAREWVRSGIGPCESPTGIFQALRAIREKMALSECALYLFVDDQASFWTDAQTMQGGDRPRSCHWFCSPLAERDNVALTMVKPAADHVLKGHPLRVFARVRNESLREQRVPVEFLLDGKVVGVESATLLPGMEERVSVDLVIPNEGASVLGARLKPDVLPYDDVLYSGVESLEKLRALVLCGTARDHFMSSWPLLDILNRAQENLEQYGAIEFVAATLPLTAEGLSGFDVVILADPVAFDEQQATVLKNYVEHGGGLFVAPSMHVDRDNWNLRFGTELFPARLGTTPEWDFDPNSSFKSVAITGFDNVDLAMYADEGYGRLYEIQFFHHFDLEHDEDARDGMAGREVLLRFSDHAPCLMRRSVGKGAVVLYASGLNGFENTLPATRAFFGMLYNMLRCAVQAGRFPLTVATDTTFSVRIPEGDEGARVSLLFEDLPSRKPQLRADSGGLVAEVPGGLPLSGLATFLHATDAKIIRNDVGIQGARLDSNLAPVPEEILTPVTNAWGITRVADAQALRRELLRARQGRDLYPWAMAVGIFLLIVELAFQRRFSRRVL